MHGCSITGRASAAEACADGLVNVQHAVAQVPGTLIGPQAELRCHLHRHAPNAKFV